MVLMKTMNEAVISTYMAYRRRASAPQITHLGQKGLSPFKQGFYDQGPSGQNRIVAGQNQIAPDQDRGNGIGNIGRNQDTPNQDRKITGQNKPPSGQKPDLVGHCGGSPKQATGQKQGLPGKDMAMNRRNRGLSGQDRGHSGSTILRPVSCPDQASSRLGNSQNKQGKMTVYNRASTGHSHDLSTNGQVMVSNGNSGHRSSVIITTGRLGSQVSSDSGISFSDQSQATIGSPGSDISFSPYFDRSYSGSSHGSCPDSRYEDPGSLPTSPNVPPGGPTGGGVRWANPPNSLLETGRCSSSSPAARPRLRSKSVCSEPCPPVLPPSPGSSSRRTSLESAGSRTSGTDGNIYTRYWRNDKVRW